MNQLAFLSTALLELIANISSFQDLTKGFRALPPPNLQDKLHQRSPRVLGMVLNVNRGCRLISLLRPFRSSPSSTNVVGETVAFDHCVY